MWLLLCIRNFKKNGDLISWDDLGILCSYALLYGIIGCVFTLKTYFLFCFFHLFSACNFEEITFENKYDTIKFALPFTLKTLYIFILQHILLRGSSFLVCWWYAHVHTWEEFHDSNNGFCRRRRDFLVYSTKVSVVMIFI